MSISTVPVAEDGTALRSDLLRFIREVKARRDYCTDFDRKMAARGYDLATADSRYVLTVTLAGGWSWRRPWNTEVPPAVYDGSEEYDRPIVYFSRSVIGVPSLNSAPGRGTWQVADSLGNPDGYVEASHFTVEVTENSVESERVSVAEFAATARNVAEEYDAGPATAEDFALAGLVLFPDDIMTRVTLPDGAVAEITHYGPWTDLGPDDVTFTYNRDNQTRPWAGNREYVDGHDFDIRAMKIAYPWEGDVMFNVSFERVVPVPIPARTTPDTTAENLEVRLGRAAQRH